MVIDEGEKLMKFDIEKIKLILDKRTSINSETNCWEYLGTNSDGYGQITIDGVFYYTHQLSAMLYLGYKGYSKLFKLVVCHKPTCKSKACWNPDHIYVGTDADNNRDLRESGNAHGKYTNVTHCVNGHEFTPENTYWSKRGKFMSTKRRQCVICRSINDKRHKAKMKIVKVS